MNKYTFDELQLAIGQKLTYGGHEETYTIGSVTLDEECIYIYNEIMGVEEEWFYFADQDITIPFLDKIKETKLGKLLLE